ncbi:MAG: hypothetical protein A3I88_02990 [Candidatus Portnoybacteria bacterium RIFCSPLOWO2_12_FULL_39_9]|nr:MAG: hypothetical protein A3H00_02900 [Candidatus Portnoybacteria bacterium RBG_13_40_8]OGZ35238.1 MAG: hypothetical protein A2646_02570 [Candidatus Portnoybacteria bacterium RIFCSPHIGHO2_02_FULL_39_12]OGZ38383.1 MAG: hypothetical protein A3F21_01970 [Candidatus Portnoybacteria bacterium RIFCSPLOWO2_01_FULL_38_39]OGZ40458.1 MAG: hypothetical protein A3I88_02990 [Candidatus Portnoybacteria bacterium RIFCSPLOWO2_12_FULL_39_9]
MTTTLKNNKKILDFIYHFNKIARGEKWVSRYDIESDSLSFTVPKLPDDARIKYLGDEVAFYLTKDSNIKGIFIEYFKSNFIKHHKDFRQLLKDIEKKKEMKTTLVELKSNKMKKVIVELEEIMRESLIKNIKLVEPAVY